MSKVIRFIYVVLSSLTLVLVLSSSAAAAAGSLDPLFGGTGTLTTGIAPADNIDAITALGIQPDGSSPLPATTPTARSTPASIPTAS